MTNNRVGWLFVAFGFSNLALLYAGGVGQIEMDFGQGWTYFAYGAGSVVIGMGIVANT